MKQILNLFEKYNDRKRLPLASLIIFHDGSGIIQDGNDNRIFDFNDIDELKKELKDG